MLGGQRQLLNGPTVVIETPGGSTAQFERASQEPGFVKAGIIDGDRIEGLIFRLRFEFWQNQVIPEFEGVKFSV